MVKRCFVVNCKTGRKSDRNNPHKYSLFKAPNDESLLLKWREHVPPKDRELTSKDCVCEKHFEKRYVIPRFQQCRNGDYYEDNIRCKLAPYAVPTIFTDVASDDGNIKQHTKQHTTVNTTRNAPIDFSKLTLPDVEVTDNDTVSFCYNCLLAKCKNHVLFSC